MAKPGDQIRASDITFWGVFALVIWAVAVLSANVTSFVPNGILGGLHSSRLDGATLNQLRSQVAALQTDAARLRGENEVLLQRFTLNERANGDVTRRVGALEMTVPQVIAALNSRDPGIDTGTTASTTGTPPVTFDVDGGSVSYTRTPMSSVVAPDTAATTQAMPEVLPVITPDSAAFGIALGPPIDANEGGTTWRSMNEKVGTLLIGMGPLLANVEGTAGKRLVVGPIASEADARQLCGHMGKVGIACSSVPFIGTPLPLAN